MNLKTLHQDSDGISPYLQCPWCGYVDVIGEFTSYQHPYEPLSAASAVTGSTQCCQCLAAGPTALFVLAYDKQADLGDDNQYRDLYLSDLEGMA